MKKQGLLWQNGPVSKRAVVLMVIALLLAAIPAWTHVSAAAGDTTAWQNGQLAMNTAGVVERSNIILQAPNSQPTQSMPLGNGVLGAAAWSANGMTVQLNRTDTFPDRKASLVSLLQAAIPHILPFPRTDTATQTQLLSASSDASGNDMLGLSYQPTAARHNVENLGLETVWPYGLIGDNSSLTSLAIRTYTSRTTHTSPDWSFDPVQAARLGLSSEVASTLTTLTKTYQVLPSGLALWSTSNTQEPYVEQSGVLTTALQEALAQDYDDLLRITPAWPSAWDVDGIVSIHGNSKVSVQYHHGSLITVGIQAGSTTNQSTRNPWTGQSVEVVDNTTGAVVVSPTTASTFTIPLQTNHSYLVEQTNALNSSLPFAAVSGQAATSYKVFGSVTIGLPGPGVVPTPTPTPAPTLTPTLTSTPTSAPTPTQTVTSGLACSVQYTITNQWPGGFGASVTINNTGTTTINGWTLTWSFANGQTITQLWNGSYTQSGSTVSVTNASYNGTIAPGGNTNIGFNGSWNGSNAAPTAFVLNGKTCSLF